MGATTLGLIMGGATAASTLMSGISEHNRSQAMAAAQQANAQSLRNQAKAQLEQGELAVRAKDRERAELTRRYRDMQARNAVSLGAGNVDASSGSALSVADGNAAAFASDIGDNAYSRMNQAVSNRNAYNAAMAQASSMDAQASAAKNRSLFPTLLGAALSGGSSFLSGYGIAGGKVSNLFKK